MMPAQTRTRQVAKAVLAAVLAGFASYCYLANLSGALGAASDENRAYHFQLFSPLIYFFSKPFIQFFRSFDAPYYIQGTVGLASILLTVHIVRRVVSPAAGWIAAVFMTLYDYPLTHAKLLYYSTLQYFFLAASTAVFLRANRSGSRWGYLTAGLLAGMAVLVNASGVIPAALFIAFFVVCHRADAFGRAKISLIGAAGFLAAGAVLAWALFEAWLMVWYGLHPQLDRVSYAESSVVYGAATPGVYTLGFSYIQKQIASICGYVFSPAEGGWFRASLILVGVFGGGAVSLIRREKKAAAFAGLLAFGLAGILLMALSGVQPFFERTLIWTVLPVTVLAVYAVETAWRKSAGIPRIALAAALAVYVVFGVQKCLAVTHAMFSLNPIFRTLEEKGIPKNRLVTTLPVNHLEVYSPGKRAKETPLLVSHDPKRIAEGTSHIIHWPAIYADYRKGDAGYYLSSGIGGMLSRVGESDPLLKNVRPLAEWSHPSDNRHLYPGQRPQWIKLYDLRDVLDRPQAVAYIEDMRKRLNARKAD